MRYKQTNIGEVVGATLLAANIKQHGYVVNAMLHAVPKLCVISASNCI